MATSPSNIHLEDCEKISPAILLMKNKILILIFFTFLLTPFVLSLPIGVTPSLMDINLTKGTIKSINVNITNPYNFSLYNIMAETGSESDIIVTMPVVISLVGNRNISLSLDIKTNRVGTFNDAINIVGKEMKVWDNHHDVNITIDGKLEPEDINIKRGDYITFKNNYVSSIMILIPEPDGRSFIVESGEFWMEQFLNVTDPLIYTLEISDGPVEEGTITEEEEPVSHVGVLNLNVISKLEETTLKILDFGETNFSMNYNDVIPWSFSIMNNGTKIAENVTISGDWFRFKSNNNWEIEWNGKIYTGIGKTPIQFEINPAFFHQFINSETGKSCIKTITIRGDNIKTYTQDITIFINHSDIDPDDVADFWKLKKIFCDTYPDSPLCISEPRIIYENRTVYDAPNILTNMSAADVLNYFKIINGLKNAWTTYENQWQLDIDAVKNGISGASNVANKTLVASEKNEKSLEEFKNVFYIIMGMIIFLGFIGLSVFVFYKYYVMRKSQREGNV